MATAVIVHELQKRLPKVITPELHGLIDYAQAGFFLCAAFFLWKRNRPAAVAAFATSALVLGESLITDYPFGIDPIISFETHGKLDAAMASASLLAPQLLGFRDTSAASLFRANAVVSGAIVGLTDYGALPAKTVADEPAH